MLINDDNFLEKKIALLSLAIIMVLTGVTFGIGFGLQKSPQLLLTTTINPYATTTPRSHPLSKANFKFLKCTCWAKIHTKCYLANCTVLYT